MVVNIDNMNSRANSNDPAFMLRAAQTGFRSAMDRFLTTTRQRNLGPETYFVPITEALWWAASVDEGYEKLYGQPYRDARDKDARGSLLLGVRYARNRGGHQRALVVEHRKGGLTVPIRLPMSIPGPSFRWRSVGNLPPADRGYEFPTGKASYEKNLAGKLASETLSNVADWFDQAEQQPWT